jgi:hypothetical protein
MASGASCWLAHDHARKLDGDWAFALPGWKAYPGGSALLTAGGTPVSSAWGGKQAKRGDLAPLGVHVRVRGCTGARVRAKECTAHTDVKTVAAATRRLDERTEKAKERMASGLPVRRSRQRHLQENASQLGSKAGITQRDAAAATRHGALG